jgi:hypothetical protein
VRANTAANGERGRVGECSKMLREGDLEKLGKEICWTSRHKGTAHAVTGNGFVMLVVISCGDGIPGRWGTKLDFIRHKRFDGLIGPPHLGQSRGGLASLVDKASCPVGGSVPSSWKQSGKVPQTRGNQCSVRSTRSVRRRTATFKRRYRPCEVLELTCPVSPHYRS